MSIERPIACLTFGVVVGAVVSVSVLGATSRTTPLTTTDVAAQPRTDDKLDAKELTVLTGDSFWGLHLEGVIPCSSMLVKGGGHLVVISPVDDPQMKCSYHVKSTKKVKLHDREFQIQVVGEDKIHVEQIELPKLAVNR